MLSSALHKAHDLLACRLNQCTCLGHQHKQQQKHQQPRYSSHQPQQQQQQQRRHPALTTLDWAAAALDDHQAFSMDPNALHVYSPANGPFVEQSEPSLWSSSNPHKLPMNPLIIPDPTFDASSSAMLCQPSPATTCSTTAASTTAPSNAPSTAPLTLDTNTPFHTAPATPIYPQQQQQQQQQQRPTNPSNIPNFRFDHLSRQDIFYSTPPPAAARRSLSPSNYSPLSVHSGAMSSPADKLETAPNTPADPALFSLDTCFDPFSGTQYMSLDEVARILYPNNPHQHDHHQHQQQQQQQQQQQRQQQHQHQHNHQNTATTTATTLTHEGNQHTLSAGTATSPQIDLNYANSGAYVTHSGALFFEQENLGTEPTPSPSPQPQAQLQSLLGHNMMPNGLPRSYYHPSNNTPYNSNCRTKRSFEALDAVPRSNITGMSTPVSSTSSTLLDLAPTTSGKNKRPAPGTRSRGGSKSGSKRIKLDTKSVRSSIAEPRRQGQVRCNRCHATSPSTAELQVHIQQVHNRPYVCVFHWAGCMTTFASKNEWKRHVISQHLGLRYWLCTADSCASIVNDSPTPAMVIPNGAIFNRKDLFTQHVRRMHTSAEINEAIKAKKLVPEWDSRIRQLQDAAERQRCKLPQDMSCPARGCTHRFMGASAWDDRMEHVAKHIEKAVTGEGEPIVFGGDADPTLTTWAASDLVGIVRRDSATGDWTLSAPLKPSGARRDGGARTISATAVEEPESDDDEDQGVDAEHGPVPHTVECGGDCPSTGRYMPVY